jgi:hypothetical protein
MYVMSMWALTQILWPLVTAIGARKFDTTGPLGSPVPWVALILAALGALILIEALRIVLSGMTRPPGREPDALPAAV